jgi:hypothetical protein
MSGEQKFDEDIFLLKGKIFNRSFSVIAPFTPFMVFADMPLTLFFVLMSFLDFFSPTGQLARKYIAGYQRWYIILFLGAATVRVAIYFIATPLWIIPIIIFPIVFIFWTRTAWSGWWDLYNSAQDLDQSQK